MGTALSLDHFITTATAIDMAIDLQNEIANDDAQSVQLRQLTFVWVTTDTNKKLQRRIFGTDDGHDLYGKHFRINRENYVEMDLIEAYRRYGHALELRVGHHANTWNYHHHVGLMEMLEYILYPEAVRGSKRLHHGVPVEPSI